MTDKLKTMLSTDNGKEEQTILPIIYLESENIDASKIVQTNAFVSSKAHSTTKLRVERFYKPVSKL